MTTSIDILDDLRLLAGRPLNLDRIQIDSVPLRSLARQSIPRAKISDVTFSPIVHNYRGGTNLNPEFFDSEGVHLSLDQVIDSVIDSDGIVHFKTKISFKISAGVVVGFAIYGDQLNCFQDVKSIEDCLRLFGKPDRNERNEAYGDLMGYDLYYYDSHMHVGWDAFGERLSLINLGDYDGNKRANT